MFSFNQPNFSLQTLSLQTLSFQTQNLRHLVFRLLVFKPFISRFSKKIFSVASPLAKIIHRKYHQNHNHKVSCLKCPSERKYFSRSGKNVSNFMVPFYGWGSTASRLQSLYKEIVYFLSLSPQELLVHIQLISEGWKAGLIFEPPWGFDH